MRKNRLFRQELTRRIVQLLRDHRRLSGFQIYRRLREQLGEEALARRGSVYTTLHRLEARGWLGHEYVFLGDRWRKFYYLTARGEEAPASLFDRLWVLNRLGRAPQR